MILFKEYQDKTWDEVLRLAADAFQRVVAQLERLGSKSSRDVRNSSLGKENDRCGGSSLGVAAFIRLGIWPSSIETEGTESR